MWNREKLLKYVPVADSIAQLSRDPSTKVGAVILDAGYGILSTGYNGFPRGVDDSVSMRYVKPLKLSYTAHAEGNAIAQAAKSGTKLEGSALIVTSLFPCTHCCKMIIQSGIKLVVAPDTDINKPNWGPEAELSKIMFAEAGVEVLTYKMTMSLNGGKDV